jgi:hypothetical protein
VIVPSLISFVVCKTLENFLIITIDVTRSYFLAPLEIEVPYAFSFFIKYGLIELEFAKTGIVGLDKMLIGGIPRVFPFLQREIQVVERQS